METNESIFAHCNARSSSSTDTSRSPGEDLGWTACLVAQNSRRAAEDIAMKRLLQAHGLTAWPV